MNESSVIDTATGGPFALDIEVVPEAVGPAGRACQTQDGCAPTCASSCASRS
jgi:FxLD family lantipeptide